MIRRPAREWTPQLAQKRSSRTAARPILIGLKGSTCLLPISTTLKKWHKPLLRQSGGQTGIGDHICCKKAERYSIASATAACLGASDAESPTVVAQCEFRMSRRY